MLRSHLYTAAVLVVVIVPAAEAATRNCTTQLVTAGLCRSATNKLVAVDLAPAAATELQDAVARRFNWQATTPCVPAMVSAGTCTAGQAGQLVPESKSQFADRMLRQLLMTWIRDDRVRQAVEPARQTAENSPEPDLGN